MADGEELWPLHLLRILLGYATVIVPSAAFIFYVRQEYSESSLLQRPGKWSRNARSFAIGAPEYRLVEPLSRTSSSAAGGRSSSSFFQRGLHLAFYVAGIQATLITQGYLLEKVMTQRYVSSLHPEELHQFHDAQFIVFCNRLIGIVIAGIWMIFRRNKQPPHVPPFYKHAYTSLSNTLSSWCQYEALKFVSFPTQNICKASKVVATMLFGRLMRGERYTWQEYLGGLGIAVGGAMFVTSAHEELPSDMSAVFAASLSGFILLVGYVSLDAFTSNWQKLLFDCRPSVSREQMMLGVNSFSAVFCAVSLLQQGQLTVCFDFALEHVLFIRDVLILSISGASGQFFIYSTIKEFGPTVLAIIMTSRQMLSIVISIVSYGHRITTFAMAGFLLVFGCIFIDIFRKYKKSRSI